MIPQDGESLRDAARRMTCLAREWLLQAFVLEELGKSDRANHMDPELRPESPQPLCDQVAFMQDMLDSDDEFKNWQPSESADDESSSGSSSKSTSKSDSD